LIDGGVERSVDGVHGWDARRGAPEGPAPRAICHKAALDKKKF
jgi:hypothetical protein